MSRFARRKDDNHKAIVAALVRVGCDVMVLENPDLLVHRAGKLFLLELKDGAKTASRRQLTPAQQKLVRQGWPIHVVLSPADALRAVGFVDWRAVAERRADKTHAAIASAVAQWADET